MVYHEELVAKFKVNNGDTFYLYQEKVPDHAGGYVYLITVFKGTRLPSRSNFVAESGDTGLKGISQIKRFLEKRYGQGTLTYPMDKETRSMRKEAERKGAGAASHNRRLARESARKSVEDVYDAYLTKDTFNDDFSAEGRRDRRGIYK